MNNKLIFSIILIIFNTFTNSTLSFCQGLIVQTIPNQINAITVFLNNAEIHRIGNINVPSGKSEIIFENISSRIINKGIKINASNDVKIYAVTIERNNKQYERNNDYKEIIDSIKIIENQKLSIHSNLEILSKQMLFIESNMKINNSSSVTFSQIDEAEKYFSKKITNIQNKINTEKNNLIEIKNQRELILKKAEMLKEKLIKSSSNLKITLESQRSTESQIDLKYLVSNAVWKPLYSIRAEKGKETIDIEYQAQVYNDTGIDWNNIPITLALLDSSNDIDMPKLEIWNLENNSNQYSKRRYSSSRTRSTNDKKSLRDIDDSQEFDEFEIDDLSTRFELKNLHKIPSDAAPHLIDVTSFQKKVDFYNLSIPKIKNGGFLIARINDWESLGLIDGVANLYYNNTFQGFTSLKTQQVNDTLDISLGKENSFSISRKKVSSRSKKSLIGFNIKENLTYEIVLKNNKNEEVEIQIKDQIPVSTSKDIEVNPINLSKGNLDPLTGEVSWNIKLGPNESKKLVLKFSIKYPKNKKDKIKYSTNRFVTPRYF